MQHKAPHQIINFTTLSIQNQWFTEESCFFFFCLNSCCPQYVALMTHLQTASVAVAWCPSPTPLHLVAAFYSICRTLYCVCVCVSVCVSWCLRAVLSQTQALRGWVIQEGERSWEAHKRSDCQNCDFPPGTLSSLGPAAHNWWRCSTCVWVCLCLSVRL